MGWYLITHPFLLSALSEVSSLQVIYLILFRVLLLGMNGLFLREFAQKFGMRLKVREWFGLSVVTAMGNYITPISGGTVFRAVYLKKRHRFPYAQFATLLAANYLVIFWVHGIVGVMITLYLTASLQAAWIPVALFGALAGTVSLLVMLPTVRLPWENRVGRTINRSLAGWTIVKQDKGLVAKLVAYTVINLLLTGASFWVAYWAIGHAISFAAALVTSLLLAFSILINITPGNLGLQEAIISASSGLLGSNAGLGLVVALLIRAATLIVVFVLGPLFSFVLARELADHQLEKSADVSTIEHLDDKGQSTVGDNSASYSSQELGE
jgi:uncharacterized membrane protein YbhN (UPF0104 family)